MRDLYLIERLDLITGKNEYTFIDYAQNHFLIHKLDSGIAR